MITASLVLYKSKESEVTRVLECVNNSCIDIVYVVDNSPKDTLRSIVENTSKKTRYFFGQGNVGYGEGNNIAMREAIAQNAKYHVIINPDIIFDSDVIDHLVNYMDGKDDVGLIKPKQVSPNRPGDWTAKLLPTPLDVFGRKFMPQSLVDKINRRYEMQEVDLSVIRNVPNFSGSFLFLRVSTLEQVGLFDERYFMYFEDFDLVRRIHKVSKTIYYPYDTIVHAHNAEHRRNKTLLKIGLKSGIRYFNKWGWFFDSDRRRWNREALSDESICK